MFQNFFKVAIRNLIRHWAYALINVFGLAIGMACSILIVLFVIHESSYDSFHEKAGQIRQVWIAGKFAAAEFQAATSAAPTGPVFMEEIPEVINYTRVNHWDNVLTRYGDRTFLEDHFYWADSGFFEIFSFPLIKGDPSRVLDEPRSMVISESTARKYFGDEDPVGRTIEVFSDTTSYNITGVFRDIPDNSSLYFDMVVDFQSNFRANETQWTSNNLQTYLLTEKDVNEEDLQKKIDTITIKYVGPEIQRFIGITLEDWEAVGNFYQIRTQPMLDVHLNNDITNNLRPAGNKKYLYIFSSIALFIILIACINFMNLSTARSAGRAWEVGLRKVVGSGKGSLVWQFLAESFLMVVMAMVLALLILELVLPIFNKEVQLSLVLDYFGDWYVIPGLLLFAVVIGLLAGSYPAFFLGSFKPVAVLSGKIEQGAGSGFLRRILVIVQFGISIFIILGTLVINRQLGYMINKDLGFDKEQMLVIQRFDEVGRRRVETFKQEMAKIPGVLSSASSTMVPGHTNNYNAFMMEGRPFDQTFLLEVNYIDYDFPTTYGLDIAQGRFHSHDYVTDSFAIVVNEATIRNFNIEEPLECRFIHPGDTQEDRDYLKVLGVMKDFHNESLHTVIKPHMLRIRDHEWGWIPYLSVRVETENISGTVRQIENIWKEFTNDQPFQYFFMDDDFEQHYEQEARTRFIFTIFSILAIFVACLGLLGLTAFTTEQRTREIGIRKAMGASADSIVRLISKEIVMLICLATLVAWPFAYFLTRNWLNDFAYRIDLGIVPFLLSFGFALVISLVTISVQAITAALKNPADSLRYE
jgi:putative ABC transport system permease protein